MGDSTISLYSHRYLFFYLYVLLICMAYSDMDEDTKPIRLNIENDFFCGDEFIIKENTGCDYHMDSSKVVIIARKKCSIKFRCNEGFVKARCCEENNLKLADLTQRSKVISSLYSRQDKFTQSTQESSHEKIITVLGEQKMPCSETANLKDDAIRKLAIMICILTGMIITSMIICKIWCVKRVLNAETRKFTKQLDLWSSNSKFPVKETSAKSVQVTCQKNLIDIDAEPSSSGEKITVEMNKQLAFEELETLNTVDIPLCV